MSERRSPEPESDLDAFALTAAHDLKASLRAVAAFSDLAGLEIEPDHPAHLHLDRIRERSARMAALVDGLAELTAGGRRPLRFGPCEPSAVLRRVIADLGPSLEEAEVEAEVADIPPVWSDETAIETIFTELLTNSIVYRGDRPLSIDVAGRLDGNSVVIDVADNGIGFDAALADEIFRPFRRLHSFDDRPGAGIGLAVCERLAARLGGTIRAVSEPGRGTTVSVRLPACEPPA